MGKRSREDKTADKAEKSAKKERKDKEKRSKKEVEEEPLVEQDDAVEEEENGLAPHGDLALHQVASSSSDEEGTEGKEAALDDVSDGEQRGQGAPSTSQVPGLEARVRGPKYTAPQPKTASKGAPVLPWMRLPVSLEGGRGVPLDQIHGLDPRLKAAITEKLGFTELFPVQTAVYDELGGGHAAAHDLCVAAPTGSGKTLAYVLPVLQGLAYPPPQSAPPPSRPLRALVVLPTRDLALQVFSLFETLAPSVNLRPVLAAGKDSLAAEAASLVHVAPSSPSLAHFTPSADILVATPGRLVAHLKGTPGFSLDHLRFLVVDETDRLLRQSYQDWLGALAPVLAKPLNHPSVSLSARPALLRPRVVKLVLSATLTRDPTKIDRLGLYLPRYIASSATDHRYKLPKELKEWRLVCPAAKKPASLVALLDRLPSRGLIVFTSSVDATHRLYLLLNAYFGAKNCPAQHAHKVAEYSSTLSPAQRRANLEAFRQGEVTLLVASDAATRGIDVLGVDFVVNYDAPVYAKTYVHRAGRTARAGRSGEVVTLLREAEVHHFKDMLRKADNNYVKDFRLDRSDVAAKETAVQRALKGMQVQLAKEKGVPVEELQEEEGEEERDPLGAEEGKNSGSGNSSSSESSGDSDSSSSSSSSSDEESEDGSSDSEDGEGEDPNSAW